MSRHGTQEINCHSVLNLTKLGQLNPTVTKVHMNILADVLKPTCNVEKHGKRQAHICPHPKVTVWSLIMMMKYGHIGETKIIDDHSAGNIIVNPTGRPQQVWQGQPKVWCSTKRYGNMDHQPPTCTPVQIHCPYHVRRNYGLQRGKKITRVIL